MLFVQAFTGLWEYWLGNSSSRDGNDVYSVGSGGYRSARNGDSRNDIDFNSLENGLDYLFSTRGGGEGGVGVPSYAACMHLVTQGNQRGWTGLFEHDFNGVHEAFCYNYDTNRDEGMSN